MKHEKICILLTIANAGLAIAGIIFLCIAIFDEEKSNWPLYAALICVILSNLFHIIKASSIREKEE